MSNTAVRLLLSVALSSALCAAIASTSLANEADDQFSVAASHYSAKRWELAVDEFHKFAHDFPDHPKRSKGRFFEGEALMQLHRYTEAYPLFVDVMNEAPTGLYAKSALFGAAEAAVMNGQIAEAQLRLAQFQSQYPTDKLNANVLMYRGDLALRSGDLTQAEKLYGESLERFADLPTADQCRLNLAHIFEMEKQPDAADKLLRDLAQRDHSPWSETALLQLAAKDLAANKPQAALEQYEAIEKRFPNSPLLAQTHFGCGRALYQLGHYAEAEGVLGPLAENKELGADARYWISMSQKAEKQFKAAAETLRPELESVQAGVSKGNRPTDSSAQNGAASVISSLRNPTPSIGKTTVSSRRDANVSSTPAAMNSSEQAEPDKSVAEDSAPGGKLSATASTIRQGLQQPVAAAVAAARDEQNRRRSAAIRYQAADSLIRAGEYDRAIATLQMGDNSGDDPRSLSNRYLLAIALQDVKRNDEALQTLDDLSAQLQEKLSAASTMVSSNDSATEAAQRNSALASGLSREDLTALRTLNENVQLARATSLLAHEKYAEAIGPLQIYLATARKEVGAERALAALAMSLAHTDRAAEAAQVLQDLKTNYPSSQLITSTTEHVAEAAYAAEEFKAAAGMYADLAAEESSAELMAKGLSGLAWCQLQLGDDDAADQAFAKFLDRFPNDPRASDAAVARGQVLEREGKDEAAAVLYRQAIKRYAQSKQLHQLLLAAARLHDRLQQDDEAAVLYQRLARDFPTSPDVDAALYGWAWSLRDLGRGNDSDKVFRILYQDHPKSRFWSDAAYRLAERASQQGDPDAATAYLKQLTESDCPPAVMQHALYLQGQMAIASEKWSVAEPPLAKLVHDYPDSSLRLAAEFWLAEVAFRSGDYVMAQQRFELLAPRATDHRESWTGIVPLRRAEILAQQKQWPQARKVAESIAKEFPQFTQQYEADYLIGRCLAAEADFDGARVAYDRVIHSAAGGKTETAAMAQWMIGESYFHQDNFQAALREYLRVEIVYPYSRWQAASLLQAAKCYEQLGQSQQASEMYARVLQNYPQTEFVAEASKRLIETSRK